RGSARPTGARIGPRSAGHQRCDRARALPARVGDRRAVDISPCRGPLMKPDVVADIGNSRIKWGLCSGERVEKMVSLPPDHEYAWSEQAKAWQLPEKCKWTLA